MSISGLIKKLQNIMRSDDLSGQVQYLKQLVWMIFLKIYDAKEEIWEFEGNYNSIIPEELKWRNWAIDDKSKDILTGEDLLDFVNNKLFKELKAVVLTENSPRKHHIVKYIFDDAANYMKDGTKLRQLINELNTLDFADLGQAHEFGDFYEEMLKDLQEAKRDGGEFYTPRCLTDFIVEVINPELGQKIADFACGTGGFLLSALKFLNNKYKQSNNPEDRVIIAKSITGIEKKSFPYALALTNLILHDIEEPLIEYDNSLKKNVQEFTDNEKVDIMIMNPPYGGMEDANVKSNFPSEHRSSETADLFMSMMMHRLNLNGSVGVVLPDGFLFGDDAPKVAIRKMLLNEFNLHTIVRLPAGVFAPYTSITTNVLFFTKNGSGTEKTWFYRMDLPEGLRAFSKTKPVTHEHFKVVKEWISNPIEIIDENGFEKAKSYTKDELFKDSKISLDYCKYPTVVEEIGDPKEMIEAYLEEKKNIESDMVEIMKKISSMIGE